MTGRDGLPGWAAIAREVETWPNSARHARAELYLWEMGTTGVVPSPDTADWHWLAVEAAAAALEEKAADSSQAAPGTIVDQGADEALCRLWEAADDTDSIDGCSPGRGHPATRRPRGCPAP